LGGLKIGLFSITYHSFTDDEVAIPPRNPIPRQITTLIRILYIMKNEK
jgi:hypothetical protein